MAKRLIEVDKMKAKKLKKTMKKAKNNVERKRIQIMIQYLGWKNSTEVMESMLVSQQTVLTAIKRYIKDPELFYKTEYKGRIESEENKQLKKEIKEYISKETENGNYIDINTVRKAFNKRKWESFSYRKMHWIIREQMGYNYQKPFITNEKQSDYAKEIIEWRMRKAIYEVWLEEKEIDAECVQNKKTKFF